ncbi:bacillithiol biosynthesis deacetylase BshB1 [Acidobacteriota bacterium]
MKLDILAFGAHADDVELACAGTLIKLGQRGYQTGVIALTRGEMATRGTPDIRAREFEVAADIMGLSASKMLDIPDSDIQDTRENRIKVIKEIRAHRPAVVLAPYWAVRHPDHENASRLVKASAYLSGLQKIETKQDPFRPNKVIYYQTRFEFKPSFIVDISEFHEQKIKAIMAYRSQFHNRDGDQTGEEETLLSRPDFQDRIETRDRQYGTYIGVKYGEPFLVREALKIDDPIEFFGPEYLETIP